MIADAPEVTAPPVVGDHLAVTVDGGPDEVHVLTDVRRFRRRILGGYDDITWLVTAADGWSAIVRHGLGWSESAGWYTTELEIVAIEDND